MKKFVVLLIAIILLFSSAVSAEEEKTSIKSTEIKYLLENSVIFQNGGFEALVYGKRELLSVSAFLEKEIFYIPSDFLEKELGLKREVLEKNGVFYANAALIGEKADFYVEIRGNICFLSELSLERYLKSDNIAKMEKLFGVFADTNAKSAGIGTPQNPVNSLEGAKNAVKKIKNEIGLFGDEFPVWFRGGSYIINKTVKFDLSDGGNGETKIVYKSAPNEKAAFQGGVSLKGSDFKKVDDPKILERLDRNARGKVYFADLSNFGLSQFGVGAVDKSLPPVSTSMYYNEETAVVARYPNSGTLKTGKMYIPNGEWHNPGFEFGYNNDRLLRWSKAGDAWVWGNFTWDWYADNHKVAKIDTEKMTILTTTNHRYVPAEDKPWYIYNLIEELDIPNEFFFDKDNALLYYYPGVGEVESGEFGKADITLALLSETLISLENCGNVSCQNLIIEAGAKGGITVNKSNSFELLGCTVRFFGGSAINATEVADSKIHGCDIYGIGESGVILTGGDRESLTAGNNEITNCRIFKAGQIVRTMQPAVMIQGAGNRAANNEIFGGPSSLIDIANGNENVYEYNEIYEALIDGANDMGTFYTGCSPCGGGNELRYNYFHDTDHGQGMIYLDDGLAGFSVYGNIFYNVNRSVFMHGAQYSQIHDNITVNSNNSAYYAQYMTHDTRWDPKTLVPTGSSSKSGDYLDRLVPYWNNAVWSEKYPYIKDIVNRGIVYLPYGDNLYNNVIITPNGSKSAEAHAVAVDMVKMSGNIELGRDNVFEDIDGKNFNLTEESEIYKEIPDFKAVNFDKIGIYIDETRKEFPKLEAFSLRYPENKSEGIEAKETEFSWGESLNAVKYRFVLAADKDFSQIIEDKIVYGTSCKAGNMRYGKTRYYWKVYALPSNSKSMGEAVAQCSQEYYSFTTKEAESIDYSKANSSVRDMLTLADEAIEGNGAGEYPEGSKDAILKAVDEFQEKLKTRPISQNKVNKYLDELIAAENIISAKRNQFNQTFAKLFIQEHWSYTANQVAFSDEQFIWTSNGESTCGGYNLRKLEPYETVKLNMAFDVAKEGSWQGIALRASSTTSAGWAGNCQYLVIVKKDTFELQSWKPNAPHLFMEYPNDCVESEKIYNIEFNIKNEDDGSARILFKVDGKTIIDYIDSDNPILSKGYLMFYNMMGGQRLTVAAGE